MKKIKILNLALALTLLAADASEVVFFQRHQNGRVEGFDKIDPGRRLCPLCERHPRSSGANGRKG